MTDPAQASPEQRAHKCFTASGTSYLRNLDREDLQGPCIAVHYQKPPTRDEEAGTTSFGLRFPMLVIALYVEDQEAVAQRVADILNRHWDDDPSAIIQSDQQQAELLAHAEAMAGALEQANEAIKEMFRYYDGGETRSSYDGMLARNQLRKAGYACPGPLTAFREYQKGRSDG